jgi:hypothetical protein
VWPALCASKLGVVELGARRLTTAFLTTCSAPPPPSTSALPSSKKDAKAAAPARGLRDPLAGLTPSQVCCYWFALT